MAGGWRGAVKDRPPVFVEAGRPAPSGFLGDLGARCEGGGGSGCDGQEGFSEPETVTHCSSTPLAWVAKIVKSWTFINLPRRADWLEPGPVFLPRSSPLSPCQWDSVRLCRCSRPKETDWGQCK